MRFIPARRWRRALCAAWLGAAALALPRLAAGASAIDGVWLTEDGDSKVAIATSGSGAAATLGGKLVWLRQPTRDGLRTGAAAARRAVAAPACCRSGRRRG